MILHNLITSIVDFHRGNFTPTVIVWTVLGSIGFVFSIFNLRDAMSDMDALVRVPDDTSDGRKKELLTIARAAIRQDLVRSSQMLMVVSIGVTVALSSPVITDKQRSFFHIPYWTPTGIAVTFALLYIVGSIMVNAVLDRRLRRRFYSRLETPAKDDV